MSPRLSVTQSRLTKAAIKTVLSVGALTYSVAILAVLVSLLGWNGLIVLVALILVFLFWYVLD